MMGDISVLQGVKPFWSLMPEFGLEIVFFDLKKKSLQPGLETISAQ